MNCNNYEGFGDLEGISGNSKTLENYHPLIFRKNPVFSKTSAAADAAVPITNKVLIKVF